MAYKKPTLGNQFSGVFDDLKAQIGEKEKDHKNVSADESDKDSKRKNKAQKKIKPKPPARGQRSKGRRKSYVEVQAPDTSCYHIPSRPPHSPGKKPGKTPELPSLAEISADLEKLQIELPTSDAIVTPSASPNDELTEKDKDGEPVIIGLDFGTAFTKAVIQWRNRHYIVDWKDIIDAKDTYLLPSSFSEHDSGFIVLGDSHESGWTSIKGLKISIIENTTNNFSSDIKATVFIALVTRYIRGWAEKTFKDKGAIKFRWRLHIGLPASPFQSEDIQHRLNKIASNAWSIGFQPGMITRKTVENAFENSPSSNPIPIKVVPEFLAQLHPYLKSSKIQEGLHGLVDIGAGTVDFVIFNVFRTRTTDKIPIFGHNVSPLGSHYLIANLAGHKGQAITWHDSDASKSHTFFSERTGESTEEVSQRNGIFYKHFKKALVNALDSARSLYHNSPVWRKENTFPFFLCGGGSHIDFFRQSIKDRNQLSIAYKDIPLPKNIVGDIKPNTFHRYSVAYGLSMLPRNLASITPTRDIEPIKPSAPVEIEDRDASR